jgi:hypothetical protein
MIRMHAAPSPASSPAEKWPNDEKAETRAPGADNEKAPDRCPGLSRIPDRPSTGEMGGRLLAQRGGVSWFLSSKGCGRGRARDAPRSRPRRCRSLKIRTRQPACRHVHAVHLIAWHRHRRGDVLHRQLAQTHGIASDRSRKSAIFQRDSFRRHF